MKKILKNFYTDFRRSVVYICVIVSFYSVLPVLSFLLGNEGAAFYGLGLLVAVFPAEIFITSVFFGRFQKIGYSYLISVPVLFIPISFIFFEFDFVYLLIYFIYALAGIGFGNLFRVIRIKK